MKKKFSKILGVGLTLALLFSLVLTAAPVLADVSEPGVVLDEFDVDNPEAEISAINLYTITFDVNDELDATYSFQDGPTSVGIAELSSAKAHGGDYSAYLSDEGVGYDQDPPDPTAYGAGRVVIPGVNTDLDTIAGGNLTYWFNYDDPVTAYPDAFPYMILAIDSGGGTTVDGWIVMATSDSYWSPTENIWVQAGLSVGASDHWIGFGAADNTTIGVAVDAALSVYAADTDLDNADVVDVKVAVGEWHQGTYDAITAYVDDIVIGATTYDLEQAGTITIEFPEGTEVADAWANTDVTVRSTAGFGIKNDPTDVGDDVTTIKEDDIYTVVISLGQLTNNIGEGAAVRVKFLGDQITNPDEDGDYTLWVSTSEEDEPVESEEYEIEVPEIPGLPGVVSVYNPSGILMKSYTGDLAMQRAIIKADDEDWVIKIGPGTYGANDTFAANVEGVTFEAVGDVTWEGVASIEAADIVIEGITFDGDGEPVAVTVTDAGTGVSFEDCAFEDADILLQTDADDITIEDCTFTVEDGVGIDVIYTATVDTTPPAITDCTFTVEEDGDGVGIEIDDDTGVTDCTFTGGSGVGVEVNGGDSDLEGCTFDGLDTALDIDGGTLDFFESTIQNCEDIAIDVDGVDVDDKVLIHNNTITGNDEAVILDVATTADAGVVFMLFNDITDNAGDDDLLVNNGDDTADLYVINNWWGDADGPEQGDDAFSADVVSEPFLPGPAADSVIDAGTDDFNAKDECGVTVTSELADGGEALMDIVGAAIYPENPAAAIDNAVGFWDVCMIGDDVESVTIRFYTDVTEDTEVYVWGAARGEWLQCDPDIAVPNLFSGFIAVTVGAATTPTLDDLGALPFAVIEPAAATEIDEAPGILAPASGDDTVSLTPIFAWGAVADADGYYFEFADNANFVTPMVKLDGDLGRLVVTAYAYVGELPYSTAYYWRVKAVSGTVEAGNLAESAWSTGVFITMDEPEEDLPPVVVEEAPPIIIEPIVEVITPAATEITPSWIYVIIGVGGVLVIALLVLIVRTRRVA